jgi:hypothetical protein
MLSGAAAMASTTGDFTVAATPGDQVPYALVGPDGEPVEPVQDGSVALCQLAAC